MNRATLVRLAGLATGVAIVASCDTTAPAGSGINVSSNGTTGSSSSGSNTSGTGPSISIDSPTVGTLINVGDSVYVRVHVHSDKGLKSVTMQGFTATGSVDLGTFSLTSRYGLLSVPNGGQFRTGLKDTTVRRFLKQTNPADTTVDSLVVVVGATDGVGAADTAMASVFIVAGPKVTIVAPNNGDSIPAGVGISVSARAQSGNGVGRIDIRVQGETNWPTKLDTTISQIFSNNPRDVTFSTTARIPINAPIRGKITVSATSLDGNRQPGGGPPIVAFVRSANSAQPRVTQVVSPKTEFADSVTVSATGDAITLLGVIVRDSAGNTLQTDSLPLSPPFNANAKGQVPLNLPRTLQGQRLGITGFAVDQAGRVGYAVPVSRASSEGTLGNALLDTTLVVYGHTYALPQQGTIGDITVDAARGNVFLSNTNFNQLNVWQSSSGGKGFSPTPVAVGSLPWGMVMSNNPDTLLVANSGGTNISRVYVGSSIVAGMHEDLARRILTRNSYLFSITVTRDPLTGKIRLTALGPISYSDRPQYIAQAKGGRIFYSTRPTETNPAGTLRWLDPSLPVPDPRQIWQYGSIQETTVEQYALMNVDSIGIVQALPTDTASDRLTIWDHPYGQKSGSIIVNDADPVLAVAAAVAGGSDAELIAHIDINSLALQDTNFVAASGNRQWIAFGEGHSSGAGRVVMVADSVGAVPNFFSPLVTIQDLTDNASEKNFGIALDKTGQTVASHGLQAYFASVSDPFHLRLQGKYDSFDDGAGIAFHPGANGVLTPQDQRLAFVGSASGNIEVVDIAYYIRRARLQLKNPIYGPLRVSLPMPGDPGDVILKIFAVSQQGLIVIDLTTADIKPGP
ncbi:MAG TPA: Ig-like domain-containing protein [Gemmatimonadaceae bacterium]